MKPIRPRNAVAGSEDERRMWSFEDRRPRGSSSPSILVGDKAGSVSQVYDTILWPKIDAFLDQILRGDDGSRSFTGIVSFLTFERKYSLVYACVANDHWEKLTQDLMAKLGRFVSGLNGRLRCESNPVSYALAFRFAATELIRAVNEIQDVFLPLDIVCLRPKTALSLGQELKILIKTLFFDVHGLDLLPRLPRVANHSLQMYQESCTILSQFGQFSPGIGPVFPKVAAEFPKRLMKEMLLNNRIIVRNGIGLVPYHV